MNYEKFNDAMCRLRQAEEDFNKALQDIQTIYNECGKELAEKTKQARWEPWSFGNVAKESKDQELSIGDEIEYTFPGKEPEKYIVINLENGIGNEKIIWTIGLDLFQRSWFSSKCYWGETYYKTGKHYDAIPFPKEIRQ